MTIGAVGVAGVTGGLLGWGVANARLLRARQAARLAPGPTAESAEGAPTDAAAPATGVLVPDAGVADVIGVLRASGIVVDASDAVVLASPSATALGLVRDEDVVHAHLRELVRAVRRDRVIRQLDLDLPRGPMGSGVLSVAARIAPLGAHHVLLLVEDRTQARRVEEVRRDFVANVSHELKTPVGGISLLAEAILDARDDPAAVERFAQRIGVESTRLTTLVQEIVELSRLQADDALAAPVLVDIAAVVRDAIEQTRVLAEAQDITFVSSLLPYTCAYGDAAMLRTAVGNLLTNAVNYSPSGTRVAISARTKGFVVEIAVADQGEGIPAAAQERIFERFYRVDAARSRATGGTGLGLAIVKHICTNHGGEVTVWSSPGHGSTFTIRLPAASQGPQADCCPPEPASQSTPDIAGKSCSQIDSDGTVESDRPSTTSGSSRAKPSRREVNP